MKRLRWLGYTVTVAALAAGCGGGGSSSQAALRQRLLGGVTKLGQAGSLRASSLYKAKSSGDADLRETGCVTVDLDRRGPGERDDRVQVLAFDVNCSGGSRGYALVGVGRRVWAQTDAGPWRAAELASGAPGELASDPDQLARVMRSAQDIRASADGTTFRFSVPPSAVNPGVKDGSTAVQMVATLDRHGALHELETTAGAGDLTGSADQTYDIGGASPIEQPKAADVKGAVAHLRGAAQLHDFVTSVWGCALPSGVSTTAAC